MRRPSRERTLIANHQYLLFHLLIGRVRRHGKRAEIPNDLAVDGAGNAVLEFEIHFWDSVFGED